MMPKIAIFYHLFQVGDWKRIYAEQISRLKSSGLLDKINFLYIGINGDDLISFDSQIPHKIVKNNHHQTEYETLKSLHQFCVNNSNYYILYFNSLGVSWSIAEYENNLVPVPNGYLTYGYIGKNKNKWRKYLEYFNIDNWRECLQHLSDYDCVGTELLHDGTINNKNHTNSHFSGNFWWSNSEYIKTLDPNFLLDGGYERFNCEFWICTNNPRCKSLFNANKNLYDNPIEEKEYIMNLNENIKSKAKIAMVSMFKNESKSIGTMLESVAPYISYWVLQDNGSTDGTPEIVKTWAEKYKIPGLLYKVEEGWVGFGWNRDHALQKLKAQDHGCDWIMKMDCDEYLEVDAGFDWSIFENKSIQAFDVHAFAPGCQYFRTWIWNSKLNWKINHDPAHETIVLDEDNQNFQRIQLDTKFKMRVGSVAGESYSNPTKYINDALKLEEKLIREQTMLQDLYHFWYIGKSYEDGYVCKNLPLGITHQREMARRCIFYFEEVLNYTHPGFKETRKATHEDEMGYYAMDVMGTASRFLGEHQKAIEYYAGAEQFCSRKNDHLIHLTETYWELMDYQNMLKTTTRLIDPNRKNPFPELGFVINPNWYVDTGNIPIQLHNTAIKLNEEVKPIGTIFRINHKQRKKLFVIDNFYDEPEKVREYALQQSFNGDLRFYKGKRTAERFSTPQIKQKFEEIIGEKIVNWDTPDSQFGGSMNGVFQYCTPEDALVYHYDSQKWAAMVFLTPNAPLQTGTSFYQHKETGIRISEDNNSDRVFSGGFYDSTKFELIDTVGNIFNRCVIFDARSIHAATEYFGQNINDSRLFHIFFFD